VTATLSFAAPPPGLAPLDRFDLEPIPDATGLYALRASDDPSIRLFLVDAAVYRPDYRPDVPEEELAGIGINSPEEAMTLLVANPESAGTTVNLAAPVLVNAAGGRAAQLILDGDWPLRAPLAA
jgi:flagellar assembly factor FliW